MFSGYYKVFESSFNMCGSCRTLGILPALFAVFCFSTFLMTYLVSIHYEDTPYPWFPVMSETNKKAPENNIFGQLLNLCSFFLVIIVFIRHLQLKHDADWNEESRPLVLRLNKIALVFGGLTALAASLVANFQVGSVIVIHYTGEAMVFFFGLVYCWIQTIICYKMKVCGVNSSCLFSTRAAFTVAATIFFIVCLAGGGYAEYVKENRPHSGNDTVVTDWKPGVEGFVPFVIAVAAEWLSSLCILFFFVTFYGEFKSIKMKLVVSRRNAFPMPLSVSDDSMRTPLLL